MTTTFAVTLGRPLGAALLLAGLLLAGLSAVGVGWVDLSTATQERDAKAELLERGVAASRRARLEPMRSVEADPFVVADSPTLAAAKVDADLRALALSAGLSLLSSRSDVKPNDQPGADAGIGTRIEDQAVVEGQNEALQGLLLKLETGVPTVLVDSLALEPAEVEQTAATDPQAPRLRMSLTLSSYWRPDPRPDAMDGGRRVRRPGAGSD